MRLAIVLLLLAGCGPLPPPVPKPEPAPDGACEAQCSRERELKCPEWSDTCVPDCKRADSELAERNSPPPDHACVAGSYSCEEMRRCP